MAPKTKPDRSLEELVGSLTAQLELVSSQLSTTNDKLQETNTRLDMQEERFDRLEAMFAASQRENVQLKEQLLTKDSEIRSLKQHINDVEQHNRSYSMRIFNLPLDGDANDPANVMNQVYANVLLPILRGAVTRNRLVSIPDVEQLLETAHILPGKDNKPRPIICRFFNRRLKTLIFQLKKDFAPRSPPQPASNRPGRFLYAIYEDLTRDTLHLMRALNSHEAVQSCWAVGGQLRYRLADSEDTIRRVVSVYDHIDDILNA